MIYAVAMIKWPLLKKKVPSEISAAPSGQVNSSDRMRIILLASVLLVLCILLGMVVYAQYYRPAAESELTISGRNLQNLSQEDTNAIGRFIKGFVPSNQEPESTPSPEPSTSVAPIAQGPQTYRVMSSNKTGPVFQEVQISEFDPQVGQDQSFGVLVEEPNGASIESVTVRLVTDTTSKDYDLELANGTPQHGFWTATWTTEDTHNRSYAAIIEATSETGTSKIDMTLR